MSDQMSELGAVFSLGLDSLPFEDGYKKVIGLISELCNSGSVSFTQLAQAAVEAIGKVTEVNTKLCIKDPVKLDTTVAVEHVKNLELAVNNIQKLLSHGLKLEHADLFKELKKGLEEAYTDGMRGGEKELKFVSTRLFTTLKRPLIAILETVGNSSNNVLRAKANAIISVLKEEVGKFSTGTQTGVLFRRATDTILEYKKESDASHKQFEQQVANEMALIESTNKKKLHYEEMFRTIKEEDAAEQRRLEESLQSFRLGAYDHANKLHADRLIAIKAGNEASLKAIDEEILKQNKLTQVATQYVDMLRQKSKVTGGKGLPSAGLLGPHLDYFKLLDKLEMDRLVKSIASDKKLWTVKEQLLDRYQEELKKSDKQGIERNEKSVKRHIEAIKNASENELLGLQVIQDRWIAFRNARLPILKAEDDFKKKSDAEEALREKNLAALRASTQARLAKLMAEKTKSTGAAAVAAIDAEIDRQEKLGRVTELFYETTKQKSRVTGGRGAAYSDEINKEMEAIKNLSAVELDDAAKYLTTMKHVWKVKGDLIRAFQSELEASAKKGVALNAEFAEQYIKIIKLASEAELHDLQVDQDGWIKAHKIRVDNITSEKAAKALAAQEEIAGLNATVQLWHQDNNRKIAAIKASSAASKEAIDAEIDRRKKLSEVVDRYFDAFRQKSKATGGRDLPASGVANKYLEYFGILDKLELEQTSKSLAREKTLWRVKERLLTEYQGEIDNSSKRGLERNEKSIKKHIEAIYDATDAELASIQRVQDRWLAMRKLKAATIKVDKRQETENIPENLIASFDEKQHTKARAEGDRRNAAAHRQDITNLLEWEKQKRQITADSELKLQKETDRASKENERAEKTRNKQLIAETRYVNDTRLQVLRNFIKQMHQALKDGAMGSDADDLVHQFDLGFDSSIAHTRRGIDHIRSTLQEIDIAYERSAIAAKVYQHNATIAEKEEQERRLENEKNFVAGYTEDEKTRANNSARISKDLARKIEQDSDIDWRKSGGAGYIHNAEIERKAIADRKEQAKGLREYLNTQINEIHELEVSKLRAIGEERKAEFQVEIDRKKKLIAVAKLYWETEQKHSTVTGGRGVRSSADISKDLQSFKELTTIELGEIAKRLSAEKELWAAKGTLLRSYNTELNTSAKKGIARDKAAEEAYIETIHNATAVELHDIQVAQDAWIASRKNIVASAKVAAKEVAAATKEKKSPVIKELTDVEKLIKEFKELHGVLISSQSAENILVEKAKGKVAELKASWVAVLESQRGSMSLIRQYSNMIGNISNQMRMFGGIALGSFVGFLESTKNLGEEMRVISEETGLTLVQAQQVIGVFEQYGVNAQAAANSMKTFAKAIEDARNGSISAADKFTGLGLAIDTLKGGTLIDHLKQVGDKLRSIKDPTERAAAAAGLLGRNAARMIPILMAGGDAIDKAFGKVVTLTDEQSESINQMSMDIDNLKNRFMIAAADITASMKPTIDYLIGGFGKIANIIKDLSPSTKNLVGELVLLAGAITLVGGLLGPFSTAMIGLWEIITTLGTGLSVLAGVVSGTVVASFSTLAIPIGAVVLAIAAVSIGTKALIDIMSHEHAALTDSEARWKAKTEALRKYHEEEQKGQGHPTGKPKTKEDQDKQDTNRLIGEAIRNKNELAAARRQEVQALKEYRSAYAATVADPVTADWGKRHDTFTAYMDAVDKRKKAAREVAEADVLLETQHHVLKDESEAKSTVKHISGDMQKTKTILNNIEAISLANKKLLNEKKIFAAEELDDIKKNMMAEAASANGHAQLVITKAEASKKYMALEATVLASNRKHLNARLSIERDHFATLLAQHKVASSQEIQEEEKTQVAIIRAIYIGHEERLKLLEDLRKRTAVEMKKFHAERVAIEIGAAKEETMGKFAAEEAKIAQEVAKGNMDVGTSERKLFETRQAHHEASIKFAKEELRVKTADVRLRIEADQKEIDSKRDALKIIADFEHSKSSFERDMFQEAKKAKLHAEQLLANDLKELHTKSAADEIKIGAETNAKTLEALQYKKASMEGFLKDMEKFDKFEAGISKDMVEKATAAGKEEINTFYEMGKAALEKANMIEAGAEQEKAVAETMGRIRKDEALVLEDIMDKVKNAYQTEFDAMFDFLEKMDGLSTSNLKAMSERLLTDLADAIRSGVSTADGELQKLMATYEKVMKKLQDEEKKGGAFGSFSPGSMWDKAGKEIGGSFMGGLSGSDAMSKLKEKLGGGVIDKMKSDTKTLLDQFTGPNSLAAHSTKLSEKFKMLGDVVGNLTDAMQRGMSNLSNIAMGKAPSNMAGGNGMVINHDASLTQTIGNINVAPGETVDAVAQQLKSSRAIMQANRSMPDAVLQYDWRTNRWGWGSAGGALLQ